MVQKKEKNITRNVKRFQVRPQSKFFVLGSSVGPVGKEDKKKKIFCPAFDN